MVTGKLTILVSGMIAADPWQGGATWAVLQYLLGFKHLGHAVYFVEPVDIAKLQPPGMPLPHSSNAAYFRQIMVEFGLDQQAALLLAGSRETVGLPYDRLREIASRAEVLINISGMLVDQELAGAIPIRVYLDLDPAFNQLWHATEGIDMRFAGHTHHVTVGLAMGHADCAIPSCGLTWLTTPPPIVLDEWPKAGSISYDALTTVANWRGYGSIEHGGVLYGQKAHSLRQFMDLPTRTDERFMLALAIHPGESRDLEALKRTGWQLLDPGEVAATPGSYRQFIQGSKAELGIAKSGYVVSHSGWFSDRSVCYLASGRPVIAQETGFSSFLPTGAGLFAFSTIDDVLAGIEVLRNDYQQQAIAARSLAEEIFDSRKVLTNLLQQIGVMS